MMANEERLALVLEANDKATATLQRVRKEIELARGSTTRLNRDTGAYDLEASKVRRGALAFGAVARAANDARLGTQGAIVAASNLAETLALVTRSAKFASWATGIGAAVAILGTFYSLLRDTNAEIDKASPAMERLLGQAELKQVDIYVAGLRARLQQLADEVVKDDPSLGEKIRNRFSANLATNAGRQEFLTGLSEEQQARVRYLLQTEQDLAASLTRQADLRHDGRKKEKTDAEQEAKRLRDKAIQQAETDARSAKTLQKSLMSEAATLAMQGGGYDTFAQKRAAAENEFIEQKQTLLEYERSGGITAERRLEIEQSALAVRDRMIANLEREQDLLNRRTALDIQENSDDPRAVFEARMEMIELEKQAQIDAGISIENANASAEQKKQRLQKEMHRKTLSDLKQLEDATINSKNRQIKAVGIAAMVLRKLEIGAEASRAAVESARAFGKVPGYLAAHQYGSAALSAASGVQLAAAAALGFKEAMGGGGSAGGGGGNSAGGFDGAGTFEPRDSSAGTSQTIYLITKDPYGRDQIQRVAWELDRAGVMKRPPTEIPPTTGLVSV